MTQKELQKLNRADLLERLLEQTAKAERLSAENARLKERITDREQQLAQTGALAAAALKLSGTAHEEEAIQSLERLMNVGQQVAREMEEESLEDSGAEEEDDPDPRGRITAAQLEKELSRVRYRRRYAWSVKSTVYGLITVAAIAVLVAVLVMPVLNIYGSSMNPTLEEGNLVVSLKSNQMKTGDVVAFYYNNKILVKRVIAQAGQWVDITEDGTVYVDNEVISEPYLQDKALGECDIELPYQVPESRIFVMGDHRSVSVDSRSTTVGCVAEEQLVGKIVFRVWPLTAFGAVG